MRSFVRTYTGQTVDLLNPQAETIYIEDIAHHLSKLDRYNGATPYLYSVGQHSILVSHCLPDDLKLEGLLHDATEAYLGDVVAPLKALLPNYRAIEAKLHNAICERFGIVCPRPTIIKNADQMVMATEMAFLLNWQDLADELPKNNNNLLTVTTINRMHWVDVKNMFLDMFQNLQN